MVLESTGKVPSHFFFFFEHFALNLTIRPLPHHQSSPNASVSIGYCRGGRRLLVCAVLMGRRYNKAGLGSPLQAGYDTHTDPSGTAEWVIFDEAAILPCFLIQLDAHQGMF
jgi:hypothetical protein